MMQVIIDGDACPVTDSVIELTKGTGIFVTIVRSFSHFSTVIQPQHVEIVYVDNGPEAVDYKIVQLAKSDAIVITQDYGLASLLLDKVAVVLHHSGKQFTYANIDRLLATRHAHAQYRRNGGRTKGPAKFTAQDKAGFNAAFQTVLKQFE